MHLYFFCLLGVSCSAKEFQNTKEEQLQGIEITWYGVTSLRIRFEDHVWLLDPFFSRPDGEPLQPNQKGRDLMEAWVGPKVDRIEVG